MFKTVEQLIFTFGVSTTIIEDKLDHIERYLLLRISHVKHLSYYRDGSLRQDSLLYRTLSAVTNSRIIINEVRVFQTDSGSVDITRLGYHLNIHVISLVK